MKKIMQLAYKRGLSIEKLAVKTGLSKSYISKLNCGKFSKNNSALKLIALVLDVDVKELM